MTRNSQSRYRPDIDGLRAIAVLAVVGYHAFPGIISGGFVGVDVFFVISGFLISSFILTEIHTSTFSFSNFYARRIRRIFPALILVAGATLAFGWVALSQSEYIELGKLTAASAAFVANFALWDASGYFNIAAEFKPLLHLWSLGIEEQFYIIWPVFLVLIWRRGTRLDAAIFVLVLLSFALNIFLMQRDPVAAFFLPLSRFWELLLGAILAHRNQRAINSDNNEKPVSSPTDSHKLLKNAISALGLFLILGSALLLKNEMAYPGWWALLPTVGTLLHLWAGPNAWLNRTISAHRALVFIGLISYPLYLWHWPMIAYIKILDLDWSVNAIRALKACAVIVAGIAAWLTYQYVEKPIRRATQMKHVQSLCVAMSIVLTLGIIVYVADGFVSRFSDTEKQVLKVADDIATGYNEYYRQGTCLLRRSQNSSDFSPTCFAKPGSGGIAGGALLWGDSEAAQFYPGIQSYLQGADTGFTQLNSNDCPPLFGYTNERYPFCPSTNKFVLEWVKQHKPRVVILAAYWFSYPGYAEVEKTVLALKTAGIEKVVIIGPTPEFRIDQPKLVIRAIRGTSIPVRLKTPFYDILTKIDRTLQDIAQRTGADFVSPLALLCEHDQCIVAMDGKAEGLMAWDTSHLTPFGSKFVVDRIMGKYITNSSTGAPSKQ